MWVPSHVGIRGNTAADAAAKTALNDKVGRGVGEIPYSDLKSVINSYTVSEWQNSWNFQTNNKLHEAVPNVGRSNISMGLSRRDEVVLHRLKIGHTHLTHCHLLKGDDAPRCITCDCPLTVKHILLQCVDFEHIRRKYFNADSLSQLFSSVSAKSITDFIKEIKLYNRI